MLHDRHATEQLIILICIRNKISVRIPLIEYKLTLAEPCSVSACDSFKHADYVSEVSGSFMSDLVEAATVSSEKPCFFFFFLLF